MGERSVSTQPFVVEGSRCRECFFRFRRIAACAAFPEGIPAAILEGRADHTQPYRGDGGIWFLARREIRALAHARTKDSQRPVMRKRAA